MFITLKNHWQERSEEELILSYNSKNFVLKKKKVQMNRNIFLIVLWKKGNYFISREKPFEIGG